MEKVESWDDIVDNLFQFHYALKNENSVPFKRFSQFFHWFYFPQYGEFAPSKFIGYKGTTAEDYIGAGSGGETNQALKHYFIKVDRSSEEFHNLRGKLESFALSVGKKISKKTFEGTGGIYIPKQHTSKVAKGYTQELYNTVNNDIENQRLESPSAEEEGTKTARLINTYERNPKLRARAIAFHGLKCNVCGFNFQSLYGDLGKDYIEVHHLVPISSASKPVHTDPEKDMIVLCSNCHRMVHRKQDGSITIEVLKNIVSKHLSK